MKVTNKLFFVALLLSLILSCGMVFAEENMTFEKSNIQAVSIETDGIESALDEFPADEDENMLNTNYNVDGTNFNDIQNIIDSANDGDTIFLDGKTYTGTGSPITVNKNSLTIVGGSGLNDNKYATLDARQLSGIMKITANNVVIKGIKFINGNAGQGSDERGGAILWSGNEGHLENSSFTNNYAYNTGGAIHFSGKNCHVDDCAFFKNNADQGGAIKFDGDWGIIDNCEFIGNSAGIGGGAIGSNSRGAVLNNSYFEDNVVQNEAGGALYWNSRDSFISNSRFIHNSAPIIGGAICVQNENANLNNCSFRNNSAGRGGAVYLSSKNGVLTNSSFVNNSAENGGALYSFRCRNMTGNDFTGNFAELFGDVVYISGTGIAVMGNFINNSNSKKAAIYLTSHENIIENNNFTNPEMAIEGENVVIEVKETFIGFIASNIQIPVYVCDLNGNPLNGAVTLSGHSTQELIDGRAVFTLLLPNETANLTFQLIRGFKSQSFDVMAVDYSIVGVKQSFDGDSVIVELCDGATGIVMITLNGKNYAAKVVNSSALIKLDDLANGEYQATVLYSGDANYPSEEKNITLPIMNYKIPMCIYPVYNIYHVKGTINVDYSGDEYYTVILTRDGRRLGAGERVTITFNGVKTVVRTNSLGVAVFKIDSKLKPKKYTIKASYHGETGISNIIIIKSIIRASDKKVKKSAEATKVKISLKKVNGKYLAGKTLKIKFNKKTYKVKTNKKGTAVWKVKKSMLKNIKAGKKVKYTVSYGKDTATKKLIIKK